MKRFDELAFVCALTERDGDAQEMKKNFKPEWLSDKELVPVVHAIFDFMDKHKCVPSFSSLHEFMEDKDKEKYNARWRAKLSTLESIKPDHSKQTMAISKARDNAAAASLEILIQDPLFLELIRDGEAERIKTEIGRWLFNHTEKQGEGIVDIKTGLEQLIDSVGPHGRPRKMTAGIKCIDEWTSGGIRPGQLGILMAPTGNGKSAVLLNIAHHVATAEEKSVILITNELTLSEQLERFLTRMQMPDEVLVDGKTVNKYIPLHRVQDDPTLAYKGLKRRWHMGLENRLYVYSTDLNVTASQLEEDLKTLKVTRGFEPDMLVIDFMERMAPATKGVGRGDKEYIYLGEIAKELVRLGKRRRCAVWTAVQTNRAGLNKEATMSMEFGQGSIRQFQEAATVIGLRKEYVQMDAEGNTKIECLAFKELKMRHSAMEDREVRLSVDLSRMFISEEEVFIPKDASIEVAEDDDQPRGKKRKKGKSNWEVKGK